MSYDPEATRARILAAAERELAAYGPAGARVERIATEAEVNKQGIYHHFGDKNELLAIVLRRRLDELADTIAIDPAAVDAYAGELFDFHVAHPELVRLVLWEGLSSQDGPSSTRSHGASTTAPRRPRWPRRRPMGTWTRRSTRGRSCSRSSA